MKKRKRPETHQLGLNYGTASNRLRRSIMFNLVQRLGEDMCFHCNNKIVNINDFTIEHKIPWLNRDTSLFWDISNISYSHKYCNYSHKRISENSKIALRKMAAKAKILSTQGKAWCNRCKKHLPTIRFYKNASRVSGYQKQCKLCRYV